MTSTPSPADFMAQSDPDEETLTITLNGQSWTPPPNLAESTADYVTEMRSEIPDEPNEVWKSGLGDQMWLLPPSPLESIAESLRQIAGQTTGQAEAEQTIQALREELADLEDKHRALYDLLADIEKQVAKSTSKLAIGVKDTINAWRSPQRVATGVTGTNEDRAVEADIEKATSVNVSAYVPEHPAHDADVEVWREYAKSLGIEPGLADSLNRSQIRTALGIEQPTEGGAA